MKTKIKITHQGAPIVNSANVSYSGNDIVAIAVDLKSKYCEIDAFSENDGVPVIYIGTDERSIHLKKGIDKNEPTAISFTEYRGYGIWSANCRRYTVYVCLVKN